MQMSVGWMVNHFVIFQLMKNLAYTNEILLYGKVMEAHGGSWKHQGSHFFKWTYFKIYEHLAYPNQIILIKAYGKVM